MDAVVTESINPYSRMLYWEVWNFMSIERGKCEFDERNIVNLKGYNDSGKSAMLNALKVLLYNANPTKQVSFIQDDKEYFRIVATFEDGVQILRDKYINGQSLYEMYKDGKCIFSTKNGNALTRVTEVPKPIVDYLGLIMYDNICLNARACFEKQIGVQTTGSENYKMFNTVLKSEEIAVASTLLNNDKNKLSSDIEATDYELQAQKRLLGDNIKLTKEMIDYLKSHDYTLDSCIAMESSLNNILSILQVLNSIPVTPEVAIVDITRLNELSNISAIVQALSGVVIYPEVASVDNSRLESLYSILSIKDTLNSLSVPPEVGLVNSERLETLETIAKLVNDLEFYNTEIKYNDERLASLNEELKQMQIELANHGVKMVRCPGCGQVFNPEEAHVH